MTCQPVDAKCNKPDAKELAKQLYPDDYLVSKAPGQPDFCQNTAANIQAVAEEVIQALIDAGWRNYWAEEKALPVILHPTHPTPPDWYKS